MKKTMSTSDKKPGVYYINEAYQPVRGSSEGSPRVHRRESDTESTSTSELPALLKRRASYEESTLSIPSTVGSKSSLVTRRLHKMAANKVKQDLTEAQKQKMQNYSSVTYAPTNSALYLDWLKQHPNRYGWERWILMALVGLVTGLVAVLMRQCLDLLNRIKWDGARGYAREKDLFMCWLWTAGLSVLFATISSALVVFLYPPATGSGVPEVIAYLNGIIVHGTMSMKNLAIKLSSLIFSVSSGLVTGTQGPMVAMGAICGAGVGQFQSKTLGIKPGCFTKFRNPEDRRNFTTAGVAAGVAAAFNAPIGGLMFAMEDISSFMTRKLSWQTFFCCGIATSTAALINGAAKGFQWKGNFGLFGTWAIEPIQVNILIFVPAIILGLLGGVVGAIFTELNVAIIKLRAKAVGKIKKLFAQKVTRIAEVMLLALAMASVCVFVPMAIPCQSVTVAQFNASKILAECKIGFNITVEGLPVHCENPNDTYSEAATLLMSTNSSMIAKLSSRNTHRWFGYAPLLTLLLIYFIMMTWTAGSAICGGLFTPTLIVGGLMGRLVGLATLDIYKLASGHELPFEEFWLWIDPGAFALLGAAALLGGTTRLCLAVTIIVVEMSQDIDFILPVMIAVFVAKLVADVLSKPLYKRLFELKSLPYLEREPEIAIGDRLVDLELYKAADLMQSPVSVIHSQETVMRLANLLLETTHGSFPVVRYDEDTRTELCSGLISRNELIVILRSDEVYHEVVEGRVITPTSITYEQMSVDYIVEEKAAIERIRSYLKCDNYYRIYVNLEPFINISAPKIDSNYSLSRTYVFFRTLGLRHLMVTDIKNRVVGIITRQDLMAFNVQQKIAEKILEDDWSDELGTSQIDNKVILPACAVLPEDIHNNKSGDVKSNSTSSESAPGTLGPASVSPKGILNSPNSFSKASPLSTPRLDQNSHTNRLSSDTRL